jgi:sulfate transport system substrate-binding protein
MKKLLLKKRILVLVSAAALAMGSLAGCGSTSTNTSTPSATGGSETATQTTTQESEPAPEAVEITNVSYDPTRELYAAYNELFTAYWKEKTGQDVTVVQSHGGSGKQALEVANGLEADVVTLALEGDVNVVADSGLIEPGYTSEFDLDSSPYTSTIVFLVRSGNPKNIQDWDDLLEDGVGVITPNPKTSGGACWNYLAAWYYFETQGQSEDEILDSMKKLYSNVLVLDSGARGATTTFTENGQGDVLLAWENEAFLSLEEHPGEYEIIIPSVSILCQPTVAVVDEVVDNRGTREVATEYLNYLYSEDAQRLEAQSYYRPSNEDVLAEFSITTDSNRITEIPEDGKWIITNVELTDINHFGGWRDAKATHFADGGLFDSIYEQ